MALRAERLLIPHLSTRPLTILAQYAGGFGQVVIVETHDHRKYALKSLKPGPSPKWDDLRAEASVLVDLPRHSNVLPVDGVTWHEGVPWLVMPAMRGNLREVLRTLNVDDVPRLVRDVSGALVHLHSAGVIHRDLKPENILLSQEGHYVISDFGLATFLPSSRELRTAPGAVVGTIAYMSPEHFAGGEVGAKADVFALGTIIYECLTGRHPFLGVSINDIVNRILYHAPEFTVGEHRDIPADLIELCLACLQKNPSRRPDAADIRADASLRDLGKPAEGSLAPSDAADAVNRAIVLFELGRTVEARTLLRECLESLPWYLPAAVGLAECEFSLGNIGSAAEIAESTLEVVAWTTAAPPGLQTLLSNLSSYYLALDPEKAISFARMAVTLDPEDWQALGNQAEACRVFGEARERRDLLEEGIRAVDIALRNAPTDLKLLTTRGGLLLALGEVGEARSFTAKLINTYGGDDVHLRLLLIRVFVALGHIDEAERWLAPMRPYPPLQAIVEAAEQEMAFRRHHLGPA